MRLHQDYKKVSKEEYMSKEANPFQIQYTVMDLVMLPAEKIIGNDYNPNVVHGPEWELLKTSIKEDGFCMPIAVYFDEDNDVYIVIDGFHRHKCLTEEFHMKYIPCVIIEKPLENRIYSTVRFNRAKGVHKIDSMSDIVKQLVQMGASDEKIAEQMGMDKEEVFRLKQITGLKEMFGSREYSKSWNEFITKFDEETEKIHSENEAEAAAENKAE